MRHVVVSLAAVSIASGAAAQSPANFDTVELTRSRDCVGVIARVSVLDAQLAPIAGRSQRLLAIAQAIALEEREVIDSLNASDSVEAAVRDWFLADGELARRYVGQPTPALLQERTAARDAIRLRLEQALTALQAQADSIMATTGTLGEEAGRCSGAVLVRPAVLESCRTQESPVCDAARDTTSQAGPFRFVPTPADLWDVNELRAWSAPGPLQAMPNGQLGGGRTVGLTRTGNIVVTSSFGVMLRRRVDLTPAEASRITALSDSLGFGASHADIVYVPSLAIQATLPEPLDQESRYALHFGNIEAPDIVWIGEAGTGAPIEGMIELGPSRLARLQAGEPLTLTALKPGTEPGTTEPVFSIELTSINQANAVQALVGYMGGQLASDLARLVPPTGA